MGREEVAGLLLSSHKSGSATKTLETTNKGTCSQARCDLFSGRDFVGRVLKKGGSKTCITTLTVNLHHSKVSLQTCFLLPQEACSQVTLEWNWLRRAKTNDRNNSLFQAQRYWGLAEKKKAQLWRKYDHEKEMWRNACSQIVIIPHYQRACTGYMKPILDPVF